jgi:ubiquinone/menaquinone biosynthesis C-methylase UbiE
MKEITPEYLLSMHKKRDQIQFWEKTLAKEKGPVTLLELGPGNGNTLRAISKLLKNKGNLFCLDISEVIVEQSSGFIGVNAVRGNICEMPFPDNYFDCINVSSTLHEVSSYGYNKNGVTIAGVSAVSIALGEISRILKPGGRLFYRDVLAPEERLSLERKYQRPSIVFFLNLFLENFLNSEPRLFTDATISMNEKGYLIKAENFLHREIQKHFLLCLENISKALLLRAKSTLFFKDKYAELLHVEVMFTDMIECDADFLLFEVSDWIKREGKEKYLYLSARELISLCSKDTIDDRYSLEATVEQFPYRKIREKKGLVLKSLFEYPEEDGTQIIVMKIPRCRAYEVSASSRIHQRG